MDLRPGLPPRRRHPTGPDDPDALGRYIDRLGRGLAVICDLIDPDVIVLGGGVSNVEALYARLPHVIAAARVLGRLRNHGAQGGPRRFLRRPRSGLALAARSRDVKAFCRDCFTTGEQAVRRCPQCGSPRIVAHDELTGLSIAHMDCDAFYASVEKRDRPELRDVPVIVGGGKRGVVTTCLLHRPHQGRPLGHADVQGAEALPGSGGHQARLHQVPRRQPHILGLAGDLTPLIQNLSLDEAWMDLSGTERLHGAPPALTLARLQARIEAETGLTVSIGLAPNKFLAKIASDLDKPRGFSVMGSAEAAFLATKPSRSCRASALPWPSLEKAGYRTVGHLARADIKDLAARYGAHGLRLHELAHGRDNRAVNPREERKRHQRRDHLQRRPFRPWRSGGQARAPLRESRPPRPRRRGRWPRRDPEAAHHRLQIITRRKTIPVPTQTAKTLFAVGREMLAREATGKPWRLIGIGVAELVEADGAADDFFAGDERKAAGQREDHRRHPGEVRRRRRHLGAKILKASNLTAIEPSRAS
jgi:DNA polymerase-4